MEVSLKSHFTEAQIELLNLFKLPLDRQEMKELKKNLLDFKFQKLQNEIENIVEDKQLSETDFMIMGNEHNRTPYETFRKSIRNRNK